MKKQRIQNPRFLAALGALGFLGLLGSHNPEVQQWAKLSWLSLLSLIVLIPTVDVNSKWANYRLHPRRKWLLFFLPFIGFLGFLGTEYESLYGLTFLAMTSQFAIDLKGKTNVLPTKGKGELIIGIVFITTGILFVTFGYTMVWLVITALTLPVMLALAPAFEIKNRLPLRELRWILLFLVMAVVLPIAGMTWFMTVAMRNEAAAVKQQVDGLYKKQLGMAKKAVDEEWQRWNSLLMQSTNLPPAQRFDAIVKTGIADSIAVYCKHGSLKYPLNKLPDTESFTPNYEAMEMGEEVTRLIRSGSFPETREVLERMAADEGLREAKGSSGRLILPRLQLLYIQNASDSRDVLESLRALTLDYQIKMSSGERLFLLQALAEQGVDVEPWLGAELLANELEMLLTNVNAKELPWFSSQSSKDCPVVCLQPSADRQVVGINRSESWGKRMQRCIDSLPMMEHVRIEVEPHDFSGEKKPRMRGVTIGPGFILNLYADDDDESFIEQAAKRIVAYILTGIGLVVFIGVAATLLVRSLLAQQRLTQMKNDFVATVTHELKTPLASTRMLVDTLLEGRCKSDGQQREYLELIARENKRLSRLIDNFLTFSRMERNKRAFNFEDVVPGELANAAVETVHENYEQCGCKLSVEVAENLPAIVADRDSMVQVLLNLLDNACKYSDGDKRIQLRIFEKEQAVCFRVEDNGIGMAKRELSKILDRFYQVDQSMTRQVGGAGLGLSIVKFIVDAHGGKIDIESELGRGSAFTVEMPVNEGG